MGHDGVVEGAGQPDELREEVGAEQRGARAARDHVQHHVLDGVRVVRHHADRCRPAVVLLVDVLVHGGVVQSSGTLGKHTLIE